VIKADEKRFDDARRLDAEDAVLRKRGARVHCRRAADSEALDGAAIA
jgi:hypothetical protein